MTRYFKKVHINLSIAFVSSCFVWLAVSPLGSIPDEPVHVIYSASVVRGELGIQEDWGVVNVPSAVAAAPSKACFAFKANTIASCQTKLIQDGADSKTVLGTTGYPPLYYSLVGLPTLFGFTETTWYLMRIVSILLSSLLVIFSLFSAKETLKKNSSVGVLLALTPMVSYMVASVNPNGLEIVAGITLTFSLVHFWLTTRNNANENSKKLLLSAALSALVLSTIRPYSWILTLALLSVLIIGCNGLFRAMFLRANKGLSFVVVFSPLIGLFWTIFVRASQSKFGIEVVLSEQSSFKQIVRETVPRLDNYWTSTVGLFGWIDHAGFQILDQVWISAIALMAILTLMIGQVREKISVALLVFGSVVLAPIGIYLLLFTDGVGYQSRYAMALTCSIPLLLNGLLLNGDESRNDSILRITVPVVVTSAFIGAWFNSAFRYSFGLPIHIPDREETVEVLNWTPIWLQILGLISVIAFISVAINSVRSEKAKLVIDA